MLANYIVQTEAPSLMKVIQPSSFPCKVGLIPQVTNQTQSSTLDTSLLQQTTSLYYSKQTYDLVHHKEGQLVILYIKTKEKKIITAYPIIPILHHNAAAPLKSWAATLYCIKLPNKITPPSHKFLPHICHINQWKYVQYFH